MNEITVLRNYVLRRERGIPHPESMITAGLHQCCSTSVRCENSTHDKDGIWFFINRKAF